MADATHLQPHTRRGLVAMAAERGRPAVAVVFDHPLDVCLARAAGRARVVDPDVIRRQHAELQAAKQAVVEEGYRRVWFVGAEGEVPAVHAAV